MTREEMVKTRWRPYMSIDYQDNGMKMPAECLLTAIDFDSEILTLTPLHPGYVQTEFSANLKYCSISKRLKAATLDGRKIKDRQDNDLKAKKIGVFIEDDEEIDSAS